MSSVKEYNIILLGEIGTGKSLFINSFPNYCLYKNFDEAIESKKPMSFISSTFNVLDREDRDHQISTLKDNINRPTKVGNVYTTRYNCYKCKFEDVVVNLIDIPSVEDTKPESARKKNITDLSNFIKRFDNINAIGILLKNTDTKLTATFTFRLKTLLTSLKQPAVDKIVFILTFSKSDEFLPGPIQKQIKLFIEKELKDLKIGLQLNLNRNTMYCFDNKSYEYLIAVNQGVKLCDSNYKSQNSSWEQSSAELYRLMLNISELTPQNIKKSASLYSKESENHASKPSTSPNVKKNIPVVKVTPLNIIKESEIIHQECNIILLGETGTGKSSFINSFANYAQFSNLTEAIASKKPISLISSRSIITDKNYVDHVIEAGQNNGNERTEIGKSCTVNCSSYKFKYRDVILRLIDTPGVGDTEGELADVENVANILSFINNFDNLHAIGIILKNNENKMTDRFTYCLRTLLTNLNKTAMNNIVFILTFSQGNDFEPDKIKDVIKLFIEKELKESNLVLNKRIMYCVDNRSYEYLIAVSQGIQYNDSSFNNQDSTWKRSAAEVTRLISHIKELTPHKVRESTSLNDARNFINVINPIFTEVLENIETNRNSFAKYRTKYEAENETIKITKRNLKLQKIDINIIPLKHAITYCKSTKCTEGIYREGELRVRYGQICCEGCTVPNGFRWFCTEMKVSGGCKKCGCKINDHERQFYKTIKVYSDLLTPEAQSKIDNATSAKHKWNIRIKQIEEREKNLDSEKTTIEDAEKKFAKFLQANTLAKPPTNKSSETAIAFTAETKVLNKYENDIANIEIITIEDVYQLKQDLISLPIHGEKINKMLSSNAAGLKSSIEFTEIVNDYAKKMFGFF